MYIQVDLVSGDLVLNRGNPEWWSFHDINALNFGGCGELAGPMAIIVSEETPRKCYRTNVFIIVLFDSES